MQTKIGTLRLIETKEWTTLAKRVDGNITSRLEPDSSNVSIQPIIICDDEIKVDDWYIDDANTIRKSLTDNKEYWSNRTDYYKILVLSNQFSPEFIQAIINGKVKDGDKVEVEMEVVEGLMDLRDEEKGRWIRIYEPKTSNRITYQRLKLRSDHTAIIHPYKQSVEDAAKQYSDNIQEYDAFIAGAEWQSKQK